MLRVGEDRVSFLNVYAPNSASGGCTDFWDTLVDVLPQADHWCVGGDFNMLEDALDRQGIAYALFRALLSWLHGSDYVFTCAW